MLAKNLERFLSQCGKSGTAHGFTMRLPPGVSVHPWRISHHISPNVGIFFKKWYSDCVLVYAVEAVAIPQNLGSRKIYDPESITPQSLLRDPEEAYRCPSVCSGESSGNEGGDVYNSEEEGSSDSDSSSSVKSGLRGTIDE